MGHHKFSVEYTDTFGGEANYAWVKRATITVPDLTHYGYSGSPDGSYSQADKRQRVAAMRAAKAAVGLTGVRGRTEWIGDEAEFRPFGMATIMLVSFVI